MLESVREAYDPKDCWSKVAKRLCGRSLFGQRHLNWETAIRDFLTEFYDAEDNYGAVLRATGETVGEFLERLVCRLTMSGDLTEKERLAVMAAVERGAAMPNLRSERAKAVLLKACFEMGRLRGEGSVIGPDRGRGVITVDDLVGYPLALPLPESHPFDFRTARQMPEYHLQIAYEASGDLKYCAAVHSVSLDHENLDLAFKDISARGPSSDLEREFLSKYSTMSEIIH